MNEISDTPSESAVNEYICTYTSGGGTEYNDGFWTKKETPKRITLMKVREYMSGIYAMHKVGEKIKVGKGTGNPLRDWEDGTFTVYFEQAGTPYYFEPFLHQLPPHKEERNTR